MILRAIAAAALIASMSGTAARAQTSAGAEGTHADAGAPPAGAVAAPSPAPASEVRASRRPEAVDITLVGNADAYSGLRARIGERMLSGVSLLWSRIDRFNPLSELLRGPPTPQPASALRCWIDLSDLRHATLYFADQRGERFLVRELPLSGRFDEVDQQSLSQVLELSVSALIENQEIGFSRAQAREIFARAQPSPAATTVAVAPPPEPARWRVAAGVFYAAENLASALPLAQGPGLILALGRLEAPAPTRASADRGGGWLAAQYQIPIEARQPDVGLRLTALAARIGVDARWWRLQARLGAGANFTHVTPLPGTASAGTVLATAHWSTAFVATGALAMRLPLERAFGPLLALSLALFLDATPSTTEYSVSAAAGNHVAWEPRRLRPGLALELAY